MSSFIKSAVVKVFSVIIPTFNRKSKLERCIKSVLCNWSSEEVEVIVWDDGSSDGTKDLEILKDARVKYTYCGENRGVNFARNQAISQAKGDYVIILDSDDELISNASEYLGRVSLGKINFFGTITNDGKKMYSCESGTYTYSDWLAGKIRGEYLPVVALEVFKKHKYNDNLFCFEQEFWNRAIRDYGISVWDVPLRIYSFDEPNRVSKLMIKRKMARKRYLDYKFFYDEFKDDYLFYNLHWQLFKIWCKKFFYKLYCVGVK